MNTVIHIYVYIYEFIYTDVCVYMIWTCRFLPLAKMKSQGLNSLSYPKQPKEKKRGQNM